ncbi:MAG TPA: antibiotic biosynthesis monooxygenase [Acidimicrobiales bacterium]|nr:antibiotic biosynthesis monooxygenase [Acidimicrobiales bacterium]
MAKIVTVFRSRLRPQASGAYHDAAPRMEELARTIPGFEGIKTFEADDGERLSVVTFATLEAHERWRDHPEHRAAQRRGRDEFYACYDITVAEVLHERHFARDDVRLPPPG